MLILFRLTAQNLVINPGAESLPRGTGWNIISQGALACVFAPTDNILNWTMKPNGTANYPFDHTTGAAGGTVFFSGCDTYFQGPFELQQTIDVSADALLVDLGNQLYTFSGFMQTPVSNQTDQGRFIVDFLNASNTVLGASYTSSWQSFFGGSGSSWRNYVNARIAPSGTRKIRIRMQTQILFNQPAINVYFDDISLSKPAILPVNLLSFDGKEVQGKVHLKWATSAEQDLDQFVLEQSTDGSRFNPVATITAGRTSYNYFDYTIQNGVRYFYRLKMIEKNGSFYYSNIILVKTMPEDLISLTPNPAKDHVTVSGNFTFGNISIINSNGQTVLTKTGNTALATLDISGLPSGLYVVRLTNQTMLINKKLLIQPK
jgi:hypothetical protein